jgi:hypothetical protein
VQYYLSQESLGPTVGVPYDYVVPDEALVAVDISKLTNNTMAARHAADTQAMQVCRYTMECVAPSRRGTFFKAARSLATW